jgi:hypothetical protein
MEEIRPRMGIQTSYVSARPKSAPPSEWPFSLGQGVMHRKFGEGTVVNFEGSGEHARVQVNFNHAGAKWLTPEFRSILTMPVPNGWFWLMPIWKAWDDPAGAQYSDQPGSVWRASLAKSRGAAPDVPSRLAGQRRLIFPDGSLPQRY